MRDERITVNTPNDGQRTYTLASRVRIRRLACSAKTWTKAINTSLSCYAAWAHQRTRKRTNQLEATSTRI